MAYKCYNKSLQTKEEKRRKEHDRKIQEENKMIQNALEKFEKLSKRKQNQILKLAKKELEDMKITPDTPGYQITLRYKIAQLVQKIK